MAKKKKGVKKKEIKDFDWCPCGVYDQSLADPDYKNIACEHCQTCWHLVCAGWKGLAADDATLDPVEYTCPLCAVKKLGLQTDSETPDALVKKEPVFLWLEA